MDILDFGNVYPSILNLTTVGLMAVIFISVMKFITAKFRVPGLSDLMASI